MKLVAHLDRRSVPSDSPADRYLRVQINAPDSQGPSTRLPLNLALVIDRSGSMSGSKLDKAKEAAIHCLRNLSAADRVAIVSYDDEVRVVSPSRTLTPETKNRLISEVRNIYSGGSTNLSGGWLRGAQEVANHQHEANYLNRVIVLTDGLANVGIVEPEELARHARELRVRGVSTTTMGIGSDYDEKLLERMAIQGGGHFYFIEQSAQIFDMLHRELGEVLSTSARRVTLEIDVPEGVRAEILNSFEIERHNKHFTVRLDDMIAGEIRSVVFKLTVQPSEAGKKLPIHLELSYVDVESGEKRSTRNNEAVLTCATSEECAREEPDSSVIEEVGLLEVARAREEALRYDAAGQYAASAATLAQAANYLRAAAPASPAAMQEAQALEAESAQAQQGLTAIARKAMHYNHSNRRQSRKP